MIYHYLSKIKVYILRSLINGIVYYNLNPNYYKYLIYAPYVELTLIFILYTFNILSIYLINSYIKSYN